MKSCEDCHWVEMGDNDIFTNCPIGCKKNEPQEWINLEVFPEERPCASFATPSEMEE